MTKSEKLTKMAPNGYCEFASLDIEEHGFLRTIQGWWWRKTPSGEPRGPSYPPIFIGSNFSEAEEYLKNHG